MKKSMLLACAGILLSVLKLNAADLCVEENGNFGCYSTITAAHNAAANGDRIIITPKAGNAPYVENLTITKSLQFLCAVEGGQYTVQGNYTITPAIGRTIVIIGMKNLSGNIATVSPSPVGARCKVSLLNCAVDNGYIDFSYDYFDLTVASSTVSLGVIYFKFGKLIGNDITANGGYAVYLNADAQATADTTYIVGNKITGYSYGISLGTNTQYCYVANNYITVNIGYGINGSGFKVSTTGRNTIINNTIVSTGSLTNGIYLTSVNAGAYVDILNNLLLSTSGSTYGINYPVTNVMASYNVMSGNLLMTYNDGTNNLASTTTLDVNGRPLAGSDAINGASPDFSYYDLDLSIGDAGAYGGSLTLDNFFPLTGGARVYMVYVPRRVNVSGTINVKADGFDR
jgi:hypothetical protein